MILIYAKQVFLFLSLESVYSSALVIFSKVIISGSKNDKLYPFEEKLEVHLLLAKFAEMATLLNYVSTQPKNQTEKVVLVHTFHGYTCLATTEVRSG